MKCARVTGAVAGCAAVFGISLLVSAEETAPAPKPKALSRKETVAVFKGLNAAAATARTFQADMRRSEESGFVMDEEPLVSAGKVKIQRPDRFRQELLDPKTGKCKSVTVASSADLWIHVPKSREVQHVDLRKGVKGKRGTSSESVMPWLTFDLEGLQKTYTITALAVDAPEGVTIKTVLKDEREKISREQLAKLPARRPKKCYRIRFVPIKQELAPTIKELNLWVDGVNPWPLKIRQETPDEGLVTTVFTNIVLDAPIAADQFEFRVPRRTKVVELSE